MPNYQEVTAIIEVVKLPPARQNSPSPLGLPVLESERYSGVWIGEQMMDCYLLQSWLLRWGGGLGVTGRG